MKKHSLWYYIAMLKEFVSLRNYAHIGDAVWELFVRNYTIYKTSNAKNLHKIKGFRKIKLYS